MRNNIRMIDISLIMAGVAMRLDFRYTHTAQAEPERQSVQTLTAREGEWQQH